MSTAHELLGVGADASVDEVKRAYRRLARRHHPDLNPDDPGAADRFRRVTDAYMLLCDPRLGPALSRAVGARPGEDPSPVPAEGPTGVHLTLDVPLDLALAGGTVAVRALGRRVRMSLPRCTGDGTVLRLPAADPGPPPRDLFLKVRLVVPDAFALRGAELVGRLEVPPAVAGKGGLAACIGPDGHPMQVVVPPGSAEGAVLRMAGQGAPLPGVIGARGDLLVRLAVRGTMPVPEGATWRWREAIGRFRATAPGAGVEGAG